MLNHFYKYSLFLLTLQTALLAQSIDIAALSEKAANGKKHLLVWLHKNGCGYCAAMHDYTLDDDKVKSILRNRFNFVSINTSESDTVIYENKAYTAKAFAKKTGYDFYPTTLFFDRSGTIVFAVPGYIETKPFLDVLRYVSRNAYLHQSYDAFKQSRERSQ